jgi:hypothetical protein
MAFCCSVLLLHQLPRSYSALFANRGRPICSETVADLLRDGVRPAPRSLLTWSEIRTLILPDSWYCPTSRATCERE